MLAEYMPEERKGSALERTPKKDQVLFVQAHLEPE